MAELKTKPGKQSVTEFLNTVAPEQKRKDCFELVKMMQEITGEKAVMWGPSIVGFGAYHYKYASGHEGDMCRAGFSPRKANITIYIHSRLERYKDKLAKLGKHKTSLSCLYINKLADVDKAILQKIIKHSYDHVIEVMAKYE